MYIFKFKLTPVIQFLVIASLLISLACNGKQINGTWAQADIVIDGERTEWYEIPFNYFDQQNVSLSLCNDSDNLYISFNFRDPKWARMILRTGLTLWLDAEGKKGKKIGINYIGGPSPDELPDDMRTGGKFDDMPFDNENRPEGIDDSHRQLFAFIDEEENKIDIDPNGGNGPSVGFAEVNGIYTYEFAFPLFETSANFYGIGASPGQIISIGAVWGGFYSKRMEQMRADRGGGRGGGLGGRGGMKGSGNSSGRMQPPQEQEIWIKTILVSPNIDRVTE